MQGSTRVITTKERPLVYYLAVAVCLALLLLLCPMPHMNRLFRYGMDLLHTPFFAIFAFFLDQKRRVRKNKNVFHLLWFGILLCILAMGLEAVQSWTGRDTNWHDGLSNIFGIITGMFFSASCSTERQDLKWIARLFGVVLLISGSIYGLCGVWDTLRAESEFPVLADFENQHELLRWEANNASLMRSGQFATSGHFSGNIVLEHGRYPGVTMELPPGDWSAYQYLNLDIAWPSTNHLPQIDQNQKKRLALQIKLEDDGPSNSFHDRFESTLVLHPGRNQIQIPLAKIADGPINRSLRFNRMERLSLFVTDAENSQVLFIDRICLE